MSGRYTYAFTEPVTREESLPVALLMDRLVPGVQLVPRPPTAIGTSMEAIYARRRTELAMGRWTPTGYTAPASAEVAISRWAYSAGVYLAHVGDMPSYDGLSIPQRLENERCEGAPVPLPDGLFLGKLESEPLTFYQRAVPALADRNPLLHWAPGAGKSRGALIYAACRPGPVVIVTPSQAKTTLAQQTLRYFPFGEVHQWTAPSLRRKRDVSLSDWMAKCKETGRIPVLIIGHETFPDAWRQGDVRMIVAAWNSDLWKKRFGESGGLVTLVFDESHKFRSHKRYTSAVLPDGGLKFRPATTAGGSMPLSLALAEASRWASRRISLTGTPLANRVDQLWVQLDLLEPGSFGSWASFALRYAGLVEAEGGGLEPMKGLGKEPPPNTDELRERLQWVFHHVTYQESHGALPPKRRQTTYIPIDQQLKEQGGDWAGFLKAAAKKSPAHLAEARTMLAASRKRGWVFRRVLDFVAHGEGRDEGSKGKVCVITGRRRDADHLRRHILSTVPEGCPVWMGHGGVERADRDRMIEEYMAHPGPCVLVGTIDSFGIAVNLQDTDLGIVAQLPVTWDQLWQLENRWARLGMTRKVLVEFPIAVGTIDEQIAQAFLEKLPAIGALTADQEVREVGESLRGLGDPEALLDSIFSKIISSDEEAA